MVIVINEYTGTSADKTRKELIVSTWDELDAVDNVSHGSLAYLIEDSAIYIYDEDTEEWYGTDGGSSGGGSDDDFTAE